MPELPEVETIRRSLRSVEGDSIRAAEVRERRLRRLLDADFADRVRDRTLRSIARRGKYLIFDLGDDLHMLAHLGMSGTLELRPPDEAPRLHDHVRWRLASNRLLVFNDPRRFGVLRLSSRIDFPELENVGPDPLAEPWDAARLRALLRGRRLPIKNLLMNQRAVAGIGNIYASEILFRAGVRPRRRADRLRRREIEALGLAMGSVLGEAVDLGGSSISDFHDSNGRPGYFQLRLAVYDRSGEPCRRCSTVIRRIVMAGRSSFYCPACQK